MENSEKINRSLDFLQKNLQYQIDNYKLNDKQIDVLAGNLSNLVDGIKANERYIASLEADLNKVMMNYVRFKNLAEAALNEKRYYIEYLNAHSRERCLLMETCEVYKNNFRQRIKLNFNSHTDIPKSDKVYKSMDKEEWIKNYIKEKSV